MSLDRIIVAEIHQMVLALARDHTNLIAEIGVNNGGAYIKTTSGKRYLIELDISPERLEA